MLREADSLLYCASLLDIKIVKECHETMKLSLGYAELYYFEGKLDPI